MPRGVSGVGVGGFFGDVGGAVGGDGFVGGEEEAHVQCQRLG